MGGTWRFHDVDADADFWPVLNSISIVNQQPCQLATFTGTIVETDVLGEEHEVEAFYTPVGGSETKLFAGDVSQYVKAHIEPIAEPAVYRFSARDYTARLDDTIISDGARPSETVSDRIAWIMGVTPTFDLTDGEAESISTVLAEYDYTGSSKREALQHIAGIIGAVFYVDFDKALQFYSADTVIAADFDLATPASPPTSYPYRDFELVGDTTDRADDIFVMGDGISGWWPNDPPSGGRQRSINDSNIKDRATLELAGAAEEDRIGTALRSGHLTMWQPGLLSGQSVNIANPTHSIDSAWVISQISYSYLDPNNQDDPDAGGKVEISLEFADRLTCRPSIDLSKNVSPPTGTADCSECARKVVILPSGMDENLSIATGRSAALYVFDGSGLVQYSCVLANVASKTGISVGLAYVRHEPGTHTSLTAGDAGLYLNPSVGPFGTKRYDISADIDPDSAHVSDRRTFWVAGVEL